MFCCLLPRPCQNSRLLPVWPLGGGVVSLFSDDWGQSDPLRGRENGRELVSGTLQLLARIVKLSLPRRRTFPAFHRIDFFFLFPFTLFFWFPPKKKKCPEQLEVKIQETKTKTVILSSYLLSTIRYNVYTLHPPVQDNIIF